MNEIIFALLICVEAVLIAMKVSDEYMYSLTWLEAFLPVLLYAFFLMFGFMHLQVLEVKKMLAIIYKEIGGDKND